MNRLQNYFNNNTNNAIHKWTHYFDIYDFWFRKYRNKPVVILEIGVFQGGSLQMWRDYFGGKAKIFAIDINPLCKQFESENTSIFIGSQSDRNFLKYVKEQIPQVDILIDDGGHTMEQQITTFEELYDHVKSDGIYLCEDLHTSYWPEYGGGYGKPTSFIEYSKTLIDSLNAWHIKDKKVDVDDFTKTAYSLHYYDSIFIIEKKVIAAPSSEMKGKIEIPINSFPSPEIKKSNSLNKSFPKIIEENISSVFRKFFK